MAFWRRFFKDERTVAAQAEREENILVISDIHLGEDILAQGPEHLGEYIRALNHHLVEFVAGHRENPVEGRRWHLVINGDMFDFVKVSVQPDSEERNFERWTREFGRELSVTALPNTPENVVWKLEQILDIHKPLFRELARFVVAGHRISIIDGNHDAEFYFDNVQHTLRETLVELARKIHSEVRTEVFDADAVRNRIAFHDWFIAKSGRYHIEHGHQYDEYSSFEYNLAPLDRHEARTLATPFTHRLMPYFAEMLGDFSTHGIHGWGIRDYLRFVFRLGPKMLWKMLRLYLTVIVELVGQSGRRRQHELRNLELEHRARLKTMSEQTPYGFETLEKLDKLKSSPAEFSVWKMMQGFFLDRFVVGALMGLGAVSSVVIGMLGAFKVGLGLAMALLGVGAAALVLLGRARHTDIAAVLRRAAGAIAEHTGARYVVFGHSHHPELVDLQANFGVGSFGERAYYINSGSWVTREILRGESGQGMTYVELTSAGAALKRWQGKGRSPVLLDASQQKPSATEHTLPVATMPNS